MLDARLRVLGGLRFALPLCLQRSVGHAQIRFMARPDLLQNPDNYYLAILSICLYIGFANSQHPKLPKMEVSREQLIKDLEENTQQMVEFLQSFEDAEKLSGKPGPEKWSVLETLEHLTKTDYAIGILMQAPVVKSERSPTKKSEMIITGLTRRAMAVESPKNLEPVGRFSNREEGIAMLQKVRKTITDALLDKDLDGVLEVFSHPFFGSLSPIEWAQFSVAHTQRHKKQMDETIAALSEA